MFVRPRDGSSRGRQEREDTVTGGLHDGASTASNGRAYDGVVAIEDGLPAGVAEQGGVFGGRDKIREHERGEETLRGRESPLTHDELRDLSDNGVDISQEWEVIGAV